MLRRSHVLCLSGTLPQVADDVADWSRVRPLMERLTHGACFDTTVFNESVIPTCHLQRSLFRLPVPKLSNTCARYLDAVRPLVSPTQFGATAKIVGDFQAAEGAVLHDELVRTDRANKHTSYISADWFDLYLSDRRPLPINYNPCLLTRRDMDKIDMLTRATFWITSTVSFYRMYLNNTLKPDVFFFGSKNHYCRRDWFQRTVALAPECIAARVMLIGSKFHAFPLDMSQYGNLLNSTRVAGALKDEIKSVGFAPHIAVQYRGHQYIVTVADGDCNPLPEEQIYARLKAITDMNAVAPGTDVGVFTSMDRTAWHAVRVAMLRDPINQKSFEQMDSAMFVLNLDDDVEANYFKPHGATEATRVMLARATNRWWDKSFSVIVTRDGFLGVNFEHSWGDGVAVLRYTQDVFNHSIMRSSKGMRLDAAPTEAVQQLRWHLTPEMEQQAAKAKARIVAEIKRMDFCTSILPGIGSGDVVFRKGSIKPDPFIQVALQLAWWRLNRSTVSSYESASTAAFLRGRTECIRSATMESQAFTMLMDAPRATEKEKTEALVKAIRKHGQIAKNAKMGEGVDRHLFALLKVAERRDPHRIPGVFRDASYTTLGSNMLSTSSLFSDALIGGGFGPVSPGYSIGYAADCDCLTFNVSCWKDAGPQHSSAEFTLAVFTAIADMHALLLAANVDA